MLPIAVFGQVSSDFDHWAEISDAKPVRVRRTRRYEQDREGLTVVDAEWEVVATVGRAARAGQAAESEGVADQGFYGTFQL